MIFKTESGSTYEVDTENQRMRRVDGDPEARHRLASGDWREYTILSRVVVGAGVRAVWSDTSGGTLRTLATSPVVEVLE